MNLILTDVLYNSNKFEKPIFNSLNKKIEINITYNSKKISIYRR